MQRIGDLRLGKVDGKQEFLERSISTGFYDTFLVPENIRMDEFRNGSKYFIYGYRGTGKTSLLRYFVRDYQPDSRYRRLVLFKSDVYEEDKIALSKVMGLSWDEADSGKMSIAQDYKAAWEWFILHKLGEMISESPSIVTSQESALPFLRILGLSDDGLSMKKVMGFLPRLEGVDVKLSGNIAIFKADLNLIYSGRKPESEQSVPFRDLIRLAYSKLSKVSFSGDIVIGFDELEAFHADQEKFHRDCMMVRDLLFVVDKFNSSSFASASDIKIVAAVRTEILQALGSMGQEVERTVHDRGSMLAWHRHKRSLRHPLFEMLRRKLQASGVSTRDDVLFEVFPRQVSGIPLDGYILDGSFYKPRDIVWRVSIVQEAYPNEPRFREHFFTGTEVTYSERMWDEIAYELSGSYTDSQILAIRRVLAGSRRYFHLGDLRHHANRQSSFSSSVREFLATHGLEDLLHQLYRLGAVGNNYMVNGRRRNRWVFRGDPDLFPDKKMEFNRALRRSLSLEG